MPTPTPNINAKLRELYDYMSADSDNDMGSLDEFNGYMQNEGNRRKLYDYLNSQDENDVGSFNDFSKALGFTNAPAKDKDVRAYEETHQGGGQTTGHSDGGSWLGDAWNTGMGYLKKTGEAIHDAVTPVQQAVVRNANVNGNVGGVSPRGEQQVRKGDGVPSLTSQPSSRAAVSSAHPGDVKAGQAHAAEQKETVPVIEIGPLQNGAGNEIDDGSNGYLAVNGRTTGGQFVSSDKIGREAVSSMDDSWSQHTFTYQGAERRADEIYKDVYQQYADAYNKALHEQEAAGRGNTEGTYTTAYSVIQKLKDEGVSSAVLDPVDEMFTRNRLKEILVPAVNDFVPEGDNNFLSKRLPAMWYDQMFQSNLRSTAQALGYTTDKQYGDFLREQVKPMLDGLLRNRTGQGLSDSGGGQLYENWEAIQKEIGAHPRFETEQQFMSDQLGELQDDIKQQLSAAHRRNMSSSNPIEFLGFDDDEPLLRTADDLLSKSRDLVNEAQAGNFLSGAWKGFANKAFSWDNWDLGLSDLPDNFRISSVLDKADKDPNSLTQAENSLLDAVVMHSAIGNYFRAGYGAEAGAVTAEAIPFMLEMALNPAGKAGSKLSEKLMRWAQRRYAGSYYAKLAEALSKARLAKAARTGEEGVMLTVAERNAVKRELQQARGMINGAGEMSRGRRVVTLLGKPIKGAVEYGVSGAALTATTGAPRVVAGAVGRKNNLDNVDFDYQDGKIVYSGRKDDGETWLSAVGKAFGDVWIENTSEYLGDAQIGKWFGGWLKLADNTAVGKFMGAVGSKGKKVLTDLGDTLHLNQVASWLETTDLGRLGNGLREFEKRAQYHGVIGEYKEEVMGNIMNAALVGDNNFRLFDDNGNLNFGIDGSVFNAEDNLRTFIGVSLMGGIMSTAKGGSYLYDKGRNKRIGLDNLSTLALESANGKISASEWSLIRERLEHGEEDDIVTVLKSLYNDYDLTTDQLSKIYGFASATLYQRGVTSARDKMQQEQEGTIEGDVQDSFDMGYDLINNPMQAVTARHRYEKALDNVSGLLSENWLDYIDSNPEEALTQLAQSDLDSADQEDIVEYINAKAVYDGIQTRINDDVASAQQRVHNYWQRRTNRETGEIEQVELTDGRTVFVVDRGMSGLEDRNPDADNAESWIVCNEDGELEFVSPDDVLTEEEAPRTQQADEVIANEQEAEENEIRAKGDDAITYGMTFDTGGSYYLADEQNVIHHYEIISDDGDGMLTVRVDGSEQSQQMSKEQFALLFGAMPANNEEQQEGAAMPSRGTEEGEPVGEPTGTVAGEPTVAMVEGAPEDYTPDMELTIRNDDGSETPALVMGRVRAVHKNGRMDYVPDADGNLIEYLMDGDAHHENEAKLASKVVSYSANGNAGELKRGKLLYRFDGGAQTEQSPATVSVTTSRTEPGASLGKGKDDISNDQISDGKNDGESAISRIPVMKDVSGQPVMKKGRPVYDWGSASVGDVSDALVELSGGDMVGARDIASEMVTQATADFEKAKKVKVRGSDPIELAESRNAVNAGIEAARNLVSHWKGVVSELNERRRHDEQRKAAEVAEAESRRIAEEKERQRIESEAVDNNLMRKEAELDSRKTSKPKAYSPLTVARRELSGDDEALAILEDMEPRDLEEWVSVLLRPHSIMWNDEDADGTRISGLKSETGWGRNDMQRLMYYLSPRDSGGRSLVKVAEDIYSDLPEGMKGMYDVQDVRNMILSLMQKGSSASIRNIVADNRIAEAREHHRQVAEYDEQQEREAWAEAHHLTPDEREAFEAYMEEGVTPVEEEIVNAIYNIIADEQNSRGGEVDQESVAGRVPGETEGGESQVQGQGASEAGGTDNVGRREQGPQGREGSAPVSDNDVAGGARGGREAARRNADERQSDLAQTEEIAPSEQVKPTDLRDAVRPNSPEIGVNEANSKAEETATPSITAPLSKEVNEFNKPFILSSSGTTTFGEVEEDSGLKAAPIKLSLGENVKYDNGVNHGYGLLHIEAGHGDQIRTAGFASVEEFVETVARNYDTIREGSIVADNQTYLLEISDEHNNTLFIQLSRDGSYWNVNSAGIFKKKYSRRKPEVFTRPALEPDTNTDTSGVDSGQTEGVTTPAGNSPQTSVGKGSDNISNDQEKTEKVAENQSPIQGLDGYTEDEVLSLVRGNIEEKLADAGIDGVTLKGMALHGSRLRGDASEDSDLDVVVEYEGNMSEDGLFNILNDEPMEIEGVRVDVNPITRGKSGTLDQYMERSRQFDALKKAERETDTEPTEAQKEAGNYKKGHVKIDGYDVTIENPKGSVRRGTDASGKQWEQEMQNTYGYIRGTEGVDGDHIDVFFSEDPSQGDVFVVDQVNKDGSFDEHKVMYGFPDIESARKAYLSNYEDGWQGLGAITPVSKEEFKKWIDSSHRKTKPFAEYSSVKPLGDTHPDNVAIPSQRTEEAEQQPKVEIKTGEDYVSAAERIARENDVKPSVLTKERRAEIRREAEDFKYESEEAAAAFDKRVPSMSDEELLAYMLIDGKGDVNKSHHPSVYDEYDYRHGDEQLQSYDATLVRLNESVTTLEQAEEMLANLQKDKTRFATEDRAELLGQEDALQDYIEGLEKIVPGHDLQEHIDTLAALQDNGKDYNKNAYDAYAAGRRFGNGVNKELTKKEAIALAHKMVDENYARGGVYILPFLDGVGDSMDLRSGKISDEAGTQKKEYVDKKNGVNDASSVDKRIKESKARVSRVSSMSDEELLRHMSEGIGQEPTAFYEDVFQEYDSRHADEELSSYNSYLDQLRNDGTTLEEAGEMLAGIEGDEARLATAERPRLLGQQEALRAYIEETEDRDAGSAAHPGKRTVENGGDGGDISPLTERATEHKVSGGSMDLRLGRNKDEVSKREKEYQAKKSGLPNEAEASTLGSSAKISSADSESPVATNKSLAGSATSVSAGKGTDLFGNEQGKGKKSSPDAKIDDVGEVLAGARKDMRRKIAESLANVTEADLIEKPFGKVYKKPDLKKAVESGALREKDAIFYEALFSMVNQQKPKVTQSEMRSKRYIPDFKTKAERWAADTFKQIEVLRQFMELDEPGRDAMMERMLADRYPTREQELAEIEKRKGWNPDYEGHKYEWGDKTTPNPLWVVYEVMNRLGYNIGDKLDVPYGVVKANTSGTGYSIENLKGERHYTFGSKMTLDEAIDRVVYLAKLKRGDADVSHPTQLFAFPATKSESGESGRYRVMWGRDYKTREFDSKDEADAFAQTKNGAYVSPIMETKRKFGYKVRFTHPLTGEKMFVDDAEFDTKEEAQAYFDGNFEKLNEATNAKLQEEREKKGEKKTLTADDVVHVTMVHPFEGGWTHAVVIDKKYANNDGQVRIIKEGFASRKDAKSFADSVKDDVLKTVLKHKEDAKKIVYFDTGENSRIGEDYRNGKNVDAEDFMNTFGFRGVQFGNWTNQADRQMAVNQAYDAFMDMARLIGVSPKAMSLNGELGIAFGARGVGGFAAHYEPGEVVINLTKTQGAGSLAHEWWHALDNYFARRAGSAGDMVTDNRRIEMRDALRKAFNDMLDLVKGSDYVQRSVAKGEYWGRTHEITARLLAEWVDRELKKRGELNTFLSRGAVVERGQQHNYDVYEALERLAGREPMPFEEYKELPESLKGIPYPSAKEVEQFGGSLRHIFDTLEEKVDEETGNVMLYEPTATYETRDGGKFVCRSLFDEMGVRSSDEVAMVSQHTQQGQGQNQVIAPSEIRLRKLKKGETCHVERVYEETKQFDFTGKEKVESAEDVAYIFRQLENAAVENSFLVLVKDGRPTVIHLGLGSYVTVMAPYEQAFVAYRELKPEQVYFVHNHPSGVLKASRQDQELLKRVKMAFGPNIVQPGIIIDTTSGKYGEFDMVADNYDLVQTSGVEAMPQSEGADVPVKVYQFSRQVFSPDWNPESAFKIVSSLSVAEFVSSHRLGEHKKMSFLVVNNSGNVVANVFLPWTKLSDIKRSKDAGDLLAGYVHQCGGVRGVLYGNYDYEPDDKVVLAAVGGRMRQLNAPLMDALHVEHSALESGWSGVGEPEEGYGVDATPFHNIIDEMFDNEDFDKSAHARERYDLGATPEWMKSVGITGDRFSLSFKNIKTHQGKDADHNLTREEWHQLPEAIKMPFLVTKRKDTSDKFRLYVNILHNGHYVAVGVDVKRVNQGKNKPMLEVNSIKTVFGHKEKLSANEVVLTYDKNITPEQEALLRGLDYREYPTIQELSAAKVGNNSDITKENGENVVEDTASYRIVDDPELLNELEDGEWEEAYRVMQVIDGELYPPMAAVREGDLVSPIKLGLIEQAEEHPELIIFDEDGKPQYLLNKGQGKGSIKAAYNPYWHTSRTALNDQFTSAHVRPNLVVVRTLVPKSELTSGYKAQYAKDAVGEMSWHSGSVSGQLAELGRPRRVILSRYDKPMEIVPHAEVAKMIAEQLRDTDIAIPYNVVWPQLRDELEKLGVEISDEASGTVGDDASFGKAEYVTDKMIADMNEKAKRGMPQTPEAKRTEAERLAKKFNTPINIIEDVNEITHPNAEIQEQRRRAKGWYDKVTRQVYVVLPNNRNVEDVAATVFHETVGHKGLRELIGDGNYNDFLREVYEHLKVDVRRRIVKLAEKHNWDFEKATDEYLSGLAEKGFEDFDREERSVWQWLKEKVLKAIDKFLKSLKLPKWVKLGDNELRYILWRSKERLERGKEHPIDLARDIVKREELGLTDEARYNMGDSRRRSEREKTNYAIDSAVSFVTGRDIKAVREERRRKEHDRKALATEIYEKVLSGDINAVPLQQINDYINDSTPDNRYGRPLSQRLPQRVERALYARTPENAIDALYSRISEGSVPSHGRVSASARRAVEERKKELLEVWAKASGNWHTDLSDYTDDHNPIGHGTDSDVYSSKDGTHVIKLSKGKPYGKRFRPDIDNVAIFNAIFPNSAYHILGYGDFGKGFVRILEQPAVDFSKTQPLTPSEREEYMGSLGFHPINDEKTAFSNGEIIVADLQKGNIVKDAAGNITVIDADCKFHTKDLGGNYSYPPVENDVLHSDTSRAAGSAAHPDMTDEDTAVYRDPDETEDIWNDQSMGLKERITAASIRFADKHRDNKTLRNEAMRAISDNLADLRKAMSLQRQFDMTTVKRVADLVRVLMNGGYISGATQQEVKRLLAAVKNSVGHNDIESSVQKVMDIMVDNRLKHAEEALRTLERTKATNVDAKGVVVGGTLDPAGAQVLKVFKQARQWRGEDIDAAIADATERMGSDDNSVADDAALDYAGLLLAKDYDDTIRGSKAEEANLRAELREARASVSDRDRLSDAYRERIASIEEAIRQNKIERAQAYFDLVSRMTEGMRESAANAKAFKEAEKQRISEIHHNANSDMEGVPSNEHYNPSWLDKFANNGFVQFFFNPLSTFEQFMRLFGSKSANGEGYLYNRFVRGWTDARQKELRGVDEKFGILDAKVNDIFGGKVKSMGDLIRYVGKLPKVDVSFWDGGEMRDHTLGHGELMYIYMVNKMLDGRMKLRKMGITEEDVSHIEDVLDPRLKDFADWVQDSFLVDTRNEYNETHKRMFGASMSAIEDYFPLKILGNARADKEEELDQHDWGEGITTATGAIKKRRRNALALDLLNANALNVLLNHVAEMEHWNAFAEFNRDINTLRTYKRFRNQVQNMTTIYGSGKELWKRFNECCQMAAGSYRPPVARADKAAVNIAKGATASCVSMRAFTAFKQFLSFPAYFSDAACHHLLKGIVTPWESWMWGMEHLPIFRERWKSRISGDPRLLKSDMDWKMWRSRITQLAARVGMTPNAFVDALTVSIGAHAIYKTRYAQYKKDGYSDDQAERKAIQDAEIGYNLTQQSSEGIFLSTMQVDRSWMSVLLTIFRNASMSYQRQLHDALRNMKRNLTPGQRTKSIEFMKKQLVRDGLSDEQASAAAKRRYNRQLRRDSRRLAVFGCLLQFAWNMGAYLPYLLFGDDDDKKKTLWKDIFTHTIFGSLEGLSAGDVLSTAGNMLFSDEPKAEYLKKEMPMMSNLYDMVKKFFGGKEAESLTDLTNLIVMSGIGINPQTITDAVVAIDDACNGDLGLGKEVGLMLMRIMQMPQSQLDELYIDELGMSARDARKLSVGQLAKRYAEYKRKKGAPVFGLLQGEEGRMAAEKRYEDRFNNKLKERIGLLPDEALEWNFNTDDNDLRKEIGKEYAKRHGAEDTYGSVKSPGGQVYASIRDYVDLAEDIQLQQAQLQAEAAGDTDRAKEISKARTKISNIKKDFTDGSGSRQDVLDKIRKERRSAINEYCK